VFAAKEQQNDCFKSKFFLGKTDFEIVQILCTSSQKAISMVFQDPRALARV
jgi:hypothetical protein